MTIICSAARKRAPLWAYALASFSQPPSDDEAQTGPHPCLVLDIEAKESDCPSPSCARLRRPRDKPGPDIKAPRMLPGMSSMERAVMPSQSCSHSGNRGGLRPNDPSTLRRRAERLRILLRGGAHRCRHRPACKLDGADDRGLPKSLSRGQCFERTPCEFEDAACWLGSSTVAGDAVRGHRADACALASLTIGGARDRYARIPLVLTE